MLSLHVGESGLCECWGREMLKGIEGDPRLGLLGYKVSAGSVML